MRKIIELVGVSGVATSKNNLLIIGNKDFESTDLYVTYKLEDVYGFWVLLSF
jgi:hypothetical protein